MVTGAADQNANVIFGAVIDEKHGDEVRVTVIATGFGSPRTRRRRAVSTTTTALEPSPRRESTRERSTDRRRSRSPRSSATTPDLTPGPPTGRGQH